MTPLRVSSSGALLQHISAKVLSHCLASWLLWRQRSLTAAIEPSVGINVGGDEGFLLHRFFAFPLSRRLVDSLLKEYYF